MFVYTSIKFSLIQFNLTQKPAFVHTYKECLSRLRCSLIHTEQVDQVCLCACLSVCMCLNHSGCVQRERGIQRSHNSCSVPALHLPVSACWETLRYNTCTQSFFHSTVCFHSYYFSNIKVIKLN